MNPISVKATFITFGIMALLLAGSGAVITIQSLRLDLKQKEIGKLSDDLKVSRAATAQCLQQKDIDNDATDDLQKQNTAIRRDNARIKRLLNDLPDQCVPVSKGPRRADGKAGGELSGQSGIMAGALVDLGSDCDAVRARLHSLQDWVRNTAHPVDNSRR